MGRPGAERHERAKQHLRRGLHDFGDSYPWRLSGACGSASSIARALVFAPSILLMDEPFGALKRDHTARAHASRAADDLGVAPTPTPL
ncbi:MAG: hypothetical protein U0Z44_06170 [Kouleothrix sp.]